MEQITSRTISAHTGERVTVQGWLQARRKLGGLTFIIVRDGWGSLQAVVEGTALHQLADLGIESVMEIEGLVRIAPQAPGGLELTEIAIRAIASVTDPLPIPMQKRELNATLPVLLDHAVVANRHPTRRALLRLGAGVMRGFRATLEAQAFTEIQTPKIGESATESGANVFKLDYFGRPAYLAQSPQFYKQIMVGVFERVYEVGPVFRAEPHDTTRHLNEYVSLDAEFGFIENHFTVMAVLRDVIAGILQTLAAGYAAELALLQVQLPVVPDVIPHLHFTEAKELAWQQSGVDERAEPDLSPQEERELGQWALEEHGSDFVYVTGYPMQKRPFYTHPDPERPAYSNSFDLLFRGLELVTGGQRLHRYEEYLAALARVGLPVAPFAAYLDAFRFGMPPHGGFAIGMERLVMQLTGVTSIKLAATFPRDLQRLTP